MTTAEFSGTQSWILSVQNAWTDAAAMPLFLDIKHAPEKQITY